MPPLTSIDPSDSSFGFPGGLADGPVVLIAADQESWSRSLESILAPLGCTILTASNRAKMLSAIRSVAPVAVIVQADLADGSGIELCRLLRGEATFDPCVPIFLTSSLPFTREQRLQAIQSGAWEYYNIPFDAAEFIAKLAIYAKVKQEADRARADSISAYGTRLYSRRALLRVSESLLAHAVRRSEPVAAVVFGYSMPPDEPNSAGRWHDLRRRPSFSKLVGMLTVAGRAEDCSGFLSGQEIAVVAPATDERGAVRLAERVLSACDSIEGFSGTATETGRLVAGCAVLRAGADQAVGIATLLDRARAAHLTSQHPATSGRITAVTI